MTKCLSNARCSVKAAKKLSSARKGIACGLDAIAGHKAASFAPGSLYKKERKEKKLAVGPLPPPSSLVLTIVLLRGMSSGARPAGQSAGGVLWIGRSRTRLHSPQQLNPSRSQGRRRR
ncbi:hypothetical protein BDA96_01G264100 [Sorghum bicolor]|uniref:Uncharacterized protein n=2 Tax=Sorghum bicolor TaxID=4558 RepID=A0A921UZF1_SORBI|nr:hypothetical protein BDA96_01G264100 [Sorghum bicolor]OQU91789.1 hypothetical protein SORBI_3001G249266 [Sorghum bicolor]